MGVVAHLGFAKGCGPVKAVRYRTSFQEKIAVKRSFLFSFATRASFLWYWQRVVVDTHTPDLVFAGNNSHNWLLRLLYQYSRLSQEKFTYFYPQTHEYQKLCKFILTAY